MVEVDEYMKEDSNPKGVDMPDTPSPAQRLVDERVEAERESLAILASLGSTKEFLGVEMTLGDVAKLSSKDVMKYFTRYQVTMGKQVTGGLVDSALQATSKVISYAIPIDDSDALGKDLKGDELVRRELSNLVGLLVLRGGRFVALASGLFQVIKHIKLGESKETPKTNLDDLQYVLEVPPNTPNTPGETSF